MTQQDLFRTGASGEAEKRWHLERHERREADWMARARASMILLLQDGQHEVSSDDVWRYCPPPADVHPSVMGPIFRCRLFRTTGWKASTRPSAHARVIRTYRLRSDNEE